MAMLDATPQRSLPMPPDEPACRVSVTGTWWGYVIRTERPVSSTSRLLTGLAGVFALGFALAGAALWIAPATVFEGPAILVKGAGSSLMALIALLLARLAAADAVVEMQVDLHRAEIREVSRREGDRARLLARYGFEEIGGLFIERAGEGRLVARLGNTSQLIPLAEGAGPALERLRDRMGRDVMAPTLAA